MVAPVMRPVLRPGQPPRHLALQAGFVHTEWLVAGGSTISMGTLYAYQHHLFESKGSHLEIIQQSHLSERNKRIINKQIKKNLQK